MLTNFFPKKIKTDASEKTLSFQEAVDKRFKRVTKALDDAVIGKYVTFKSLITLAHLQEEWENSKAVESLDIFSYVADLFIEIEDNKDMEKLFTMIDEAPNDRLRELYGVCAELTLFPYSKIWTFPDMTQAALKILEEAEIPYKFLKMTEEKSFTYVIPTPEVLLKSDKYIAPLFANNRAYEEAIEDAYNPEAEARVKKYCGAKNIRSRYIA